MKVHRLFFAAGRSKTPAAAPPATSAGTQPGSCEVEWPGSIDLTPLDLRVPRRCVKLLDMF